MPSQVVSYALDDSTVAFALSGQMMVASAGIRGYRNPIIGLAAGIICIDLDPDLASSDGQMAIKPRDRRPVCGVAAFGPGTEHVP